MEILSAGSSLVRDPAGDINHIFKRKGWGRQPSGEGGEEPRRVRGDVHLVSIALAEEQVSTPGVTRGCTTGS